MVYDKSSPSGFARRLAARIGDSAAKTLARPWARPLARATGQIRGVMFLRDATEAMEVEDYRVAEALFMRVLGMDAPWTTRLMAYHGAVVSRLRLGRYAEAVQLADDALGLWVSGRERDSLSTDDRVAHDALMEARKFGRWAVDHPYAAGEMRQRERRDRRSAQQDPRLLTESETAPLGQSTQWPTLLQSGYRIAVHGLMAAGLVAVAANQPSGARALLRTALVASRYDHRLERDVCWHLTRVDEVLGMQTEADRHRARYEHLNERVRKALRRMRWTN
jgi:hypothetical protein